MGQSPDRLTRDSGNIRGTLGQGRRVGGGSSSSSLTVIARHQRRELAATWRAGMSRQPRRACATPHEPGGRCCHGFLRALRRRRLERAGRPTVPSGNWLVLGSGWGEQTGCSGSCCAGKASRQLQRPAAWLGHTAAAASFVAGSHVRNTWWVTAVVTVCWWPLAPPVPEK